MAGLMRSDSFLFMIRRAAHGSEAARYSSQAVSSCPCCSHAFPTASIIRCLSEASSMKLLSAPAYTVTMTLTLHSIHGCNRRGHADVMLGTNKSASIQLHQGLLAQPLLASTSTWGCPSIYAVCYDCGMHVKATSFKGDMFMSTCLKTAGTEHF